MNKNKKVEKIIDTALALLKSVGDQGLSMRQVAANSDMSLSNVQYYFKTKDQLLKAMAERYFQHCLHDLRAMPPLQSQQTIETELHAMLTEFLSHRQAVSEICSMFREYWAIATRSEVIADYLKQYYLQVAEVLSEKLRPVANSEQGVNCVITFLIPFLEGYAVTIKALPETPEKTATFLTKILTELLLIESS
ncbi:TetR/AcrR family transcriptional regulator [Pseudoalteromonas sp. T1lg65]|uniref:TetR/AcrR family transcriptional regulator n=1 Tax=Pseudoalteromonas sp. T1lg65 TaxID=2077101 RepID=UPI003F799A5F